MERGLRVVIIRDLVCQHNYAKTQILEVMPHYQEYIAFQEPPLNLGLQVDGHEQVSWSFPDNNACSYSGQQTTWQPPSLEPAPGSSGVGASSGRRLFTSWGNKFSQSTKIYLTLNKC